MKKGMNGRLALTLLISLGLSGCKTFDTVPPKIEKMAEGAAKERKVDSISSAIEFADDAVSTWIGVRKSLAEEDRYFDIPIIGGALVAVGALIGGANNKVPIIAGSVAGGAQLTRANYASGEKINIYSEGISAMRCVSIVGSGVAFVDGERPRELEGFRAALKGRLAQADAHAEAAASSLSPDVKVSFNEAKAAAKEALNAAKALIDAAVSARGKVIYTTLSIRETVDDRIIGVYRRASFDEVYGKLVTGAAQSMAGQDQLSELRRRASAAVAKLEGGTPLPAFKAAKVAPDPNAIMNEHISALNQLASELADPKYLLLTTLDQDLGKCRAKVS